MCGLSTPRDIPAPPQRAAPPPFLPPGTACGHRPREDSLHHVVNTDHLRSNGTARCQVPSLSVSGPSRGLRSLHGGAPCPLRNSHSKRRETCRRRGPASGAYEGEGKQGQCRPHRPAAPPARTASPASHRQTGEVRPQPLPQMNPGLVSVCFGASEALGDRV